MKPTVECWTDRGYELGIYGTPEMEDAGMNLAQVILLLYSYYVFVQFVYSIYMLNS